MPHLKFQFPLLLSSLILLLIVAGLSVQPVEAQCGSQASSCKNCHEVQGEMPVNTDGTGWHESHAFGDFCYICHAGNQQSMELDAAHAGMVPPLDDINASCEMCHADDLNERAEVYAKILNIDLGSSSGDSGAAASTSDSSGDDFWGSEPAAVDVEPAEAAAPMAAVDEQSVDCPPQFDELVVDDANIVNYTQRYNEIVLGERPVNWGNIILGGLIGALVIGGGGFVLLNEIRLNTTLAETRKAQGEYPADVVEMLPALSEMKTPTRKALKKILAHPQKADKVLGMVDSLISDEETEGGGQ